MSTLDDIIALLPTAKLEHDGMVVQLAEAQAEVVRLRGLLYPPPPVLHTTAFRPPECSPEIDAVIKAMVAKYNLPRWFYYAQIQRESSFNAKAYNPNGGYGLTQLTGPWYVGQPYPQNLGMPDDNNQAWKANMGIGEYGPWISMARVSRLTDPLDPAQNLDRYSTGYAVPAFSLWKARYRLDDAETLRALAWHYNHGVPGHRYIPGMMDPSYLALYDHYYAMYQAACLADGDHAWDGKPVLP